MFNIRRFSNISEYQNYKNSSAYKYPSLSKIGQAGVFDENTVVKYNIELEEEELENTVVKYNIELEEEELRFNILSDGAITWNLVGDTNDASQTIQYSKNGGAWTNLASSIEGASIEVQTGDMLKFKGTNTAYGSHEYIDGSSASHTVSSNFGATCQFSVLGNIMSLVSADFANPDLVLTTDFEFAGLFKDCEGIVDASNLILPATTLSASCYRELFFLKLYIIFNHSILIKNPSLAYFR